MIQNGSIKSFKILQSLGKTEEYLMLKFMEYMGGVQNDEYEYLCYCR